MSSTAAKPVKTVGVYKAKTHLPELLDWVSRGREVTITRHSRSLARLVPVEPAVDRSVFARMRALRSRLSLPRGETARDLVEAGRRI